MTNFTENANLIPILPRLASFCTISLARRIHENIFLSTLNIFLSVTAVLGNVLILVALQKETSLHPPSKLFFRCLASTDLCVGLISQPLYVIYYVALLRNHWNLCYYSFGLTISLSTTFCGVSLLTLTAISIDRLLALLLRLRYRQIVTLRRVRIVVFALWLWCVLFTTMFSIMPDIIIRMLGANLLLCIVISSACYAKLYHALRHHQTQVHVHHIQLNGQGNILNIARHRKMVSTVLLLQMSLFFCYLSYYIIVFTFTVTGSNLEKPLATNVAFRWAASLTPVFLNSSLNPTLYCWKIREVRQAVRGTMRDFCSYICSS